VVQGAPELVGRPAAEAGVGVGGEVRRKDVAERRLDRPAAGEKAPAARGVAAGAVAGAGERFAARQQLGARGDARRAGPSRSSPSRLSQATTPASATSTPSAARPAMPRRGASSSRRCRPRRCGTPPQAIGIGVANPLAGFAPAGTGWPASHAEIRPISSGASFFAIAAMQSGSWATRLPLRQAPSWALR
jgi:hypothetical protein